MTDLTRVLGSQALSHHAESSASIDADVDRVFAYMDDHTHLSSHMSESSWVMGGGRMDVELDASRGQQVGSTIRLSGRAFGIRLSLEEIVAERSAPHRKVWETTALPKLLVIGHYRMGFEIAPQRKGSLLRVFIDYAAPETIPTRWLGSLFGGFYGRWCTQRMVRDAAQHFTREQ